jgi:caa(3)-type oxidase subunit IV
MSRSHLHNILVWLALVGLAVIEFCGSFASLPIGVRPVLALPAIMMAAVVALGFMRLASAPSTAKGFAIAGLFWLTVLLGLSMMDPMTRTLYAVTQ